MKLRIIMLILGGKSQKVDVDPLRSKNIII